MAITYFGYTDTSGLSWYAIDTQTIRNKTTNASFVCPGTGTQKLISLGLYVKGGDTASDIRLAIYDTSLNFIAQGSAKITIGILVAAAWAEHTAFTNVAGNPIFPTLTGGTTYVVAVTMDDQGASKAYKAVANGDVLYLATDYTDAGFPDPLAAGAADTTGIRIQAGVEPAGTVVPQAMAYYRRLRG